MDEGQRQNPIKVGNLTNTFFSLFTLVLILKISKKLIMGTIKLGGIFYNRHFVGVSLVITMTHLVLMDLYLVTLAIQ